MLLIGIDGGASKVRACVVNYDKQLDIYSLSEMNVKRQYRQYPTFNNDFVPCDINTQLSQINYKLKLSDKEILQGTSYIDACTDVVLELTKMSGINKALIGIGMPGIKTKDKRGVAILSNGPRLPRFLDILEEKLQSKNIEIVAKISYLGSDADYCGIGEEFHKNGSFRGLQNVYYIGGGTGIADALKLKGKLITFDDNKDWIAKTWEMKPKSGLAFERYISAKGIQNTYSRLSGISSSKINSQNIFPNEIMQLAISGNQIAIDTFKEVGKNIARVIFERIITIYFGWKTNSESIVYNRNLNNEHRYRGTLLDGIVIAQRLASLLNKYKPHNLFWDTILNELTRLVIPVIDTRFKKHYLQNNKFDKNLLKISSLTEAPCIGAAIDAHRRFNNFIYE